MEKVIATELAVGGVDQTNLELLESNASRLGLDEAVIYYGFPVFRDYEENSVKSGLCIISKNHGVIVINSSNEHQLESDDLELSQLFSLMEASFRKSVKLRSGKKKLIFNFDSLLFCTSTGSIDLSALENEVLGSWAAIEKLLDDERLDSQLSQDIFDEVRSIIEGSKALKKPIKRTQISEDPSTMLNVLIELEKEISNFDVEQRKIAISLINGPQRIRGLAGSGKTIVLAMKAAHIHLQHPNKKILFTFYTKSLYLLIKETIARFYRHFAGDEPNWESIHILHAWGGRSIDGVAYNASVDNSILNISFSEAKNRNYKDPFSEVCKSFDGKYLKPKYDYILIDEAQDLPNEFFQLCFKLAKENNETRNIVWAYDDLQSIFNVYQRTPEELFGLDENGIHRINLNKLSENLSLGQSNDLVLYKCYRNPLEILVVAHALGFGIYSDQMVQTLENKDHWEDVGYTFDGDVELKVGEQVTITRTIENSPLSIYEHQSKDDIVRYFLAKSIDEECSWVVNEIARSTAQGIKPNDILIVCLDDRNAKAYFSRLSKKLSSVNIRSNNLLISSSAAPPFVLDDMVTMSTVHRAKGNEAALVFAIGIDALYQERRTRSGRNKIFTAFTRTKAWLRVSGMGESANSFFQEIDKSLENSPSLVFEVPSAKDIETIQRDLEGRPKEILKLQEAVSSLKEKGYTDADIQLELSLLGDVNDK